MGVHPDHEVPISPPAFAQGAACRGQPSGVSFPHPSDCAAFYTCVGGRALTQKCAPGLLFDARSRMCNWPVVVDCGTRRSTQGTTGKAAALPIVPLKDGVHHPYHRVPATPAHPSLCSFLSLAPPTTHPDRQPTSDGGCQHPSPLSREC